MKRAEAVIFDMDGVIVDSEPWHERAFLEVLREIGFNERIELRIADYVGRSDRDLWMDFVARYKPAQTLEQLLSRKRSVVIEMLRREQPLFAGLKALVEELANSYKLAVASGSERMVVEEVLALENLCQHFSTVVTSAEVARGKPAPDIFLRAAQLLGIKPCDCWVIEDSKPGVAGGLAAGMRVVAITNTHPAVELAQASYVVSSYPEIAKLLRPD
jgi:HAD superfamily hydrolase (TIGR01509 family)